MLERLTPNSPYKGGINKTSGRPITARGKLIAE
jgi:hypothetical protein